MRHNVLEDLYYGRITPAEEAFAQSEELAEAQQRLLACEDKLISLLGEHGREQIQELDSLCRSVDSFYYAGCFRSGFRLGALLLLEVLG